MRYNDELRGQESHIKYGEIYMSFADLKKNAKSLSEIVEAAKAAEGSTNNSKDDRFWIPSKDKAGNGYAVIRFLPGLQVDGQPWVRYWDHAFKGPTGQWYIEKSLTSIGQQDAIAELNSKLWNSGRESDKEIVRKRKRNLRYVSNILVISDPANPENEGKVMLFRYGKKIHDKIMEAMSPQFPDETPINPFNMWEGADFVLKIRKVEGYANYDASSFKSPSAINDDDDVLEQIYDKQYDLSEWSDPKNYKSYDELKERLDLVLGLKKNADPVKEQSMADEMNDGIPDFGSKPEPEYSSASEPEIPTAESSMDDDDDIMAKFAALANDD